MQPITRHCPPLAHLVRLPEMGDGLSLDGGRHHFFDSKSFNAALFSIESANRFSPSSCFSRLADPMLAAQIASYPARAPAKPR
ncbi:hypothetical protein JQ624_37375 [Bradyrhizobium sp. AUGA SZCCT0283]|nr:hypothetical protein [Bradyrhizobium sp. AUGA SZCCT0283]